MTLAAFQYRAINGQGAAVRGVLHAPGHREAYQQIMAAGLRPTRIAPARRAWRLALIQPISKKALAHLTYQFSIFMQAGIPVAEGLQAMAEQENNERLRAIIEDIAQRIASGRTITDSLTPHAAVFGPVYVESIRAAERSGKMTAILEELASMLEQEHETQRRMRSALLYPLCVVVALLLAVVFLTVFVVPRFVGMFSARGMDLPAPTRIVAALGMFLRHWWPVLMVALGGGSVALRYALRRPGIRVRLDHWLHRVPGIRDIMRHAAVTRFARVLGLTLQSGLGLIEALELAGRASARPLLIADAEKMRQQVNRGGKLSDVVMACAYLPPFARRMIVSGVDAAELPRMCTVIVRHHARELEYLTRNMATLIEPIVVVGLAAVVLLVALAFFLPMWNMGALMG